MSDKKDLRAIVKDLKGDGMQCNCDLDRWEPEIDTGHSWVCRIHKQAKHVERERAQQGKD